jgi:D-alanine-D-alanine ligase
MRVLVLHSDVAAGAPPDEMDTLITADAVARALKQRGHDAAKAAFAAEPAALTAVLDNVRPDVVFNLVESVHGDGLLAAMAPAMLEKLGVAYTGADAGCLALSSDKILSKRVLRAAGLPTADWGEPPSWSELVADLRYVVKSVTEDASLGLDDGAVVAGTEVAARAEASKALYGGRWFAEIYLDGREFNVALLEDGPGLRVLPIAEMRFEAWDERRPRIVGYAAKWSETSSDATNTVRAFGVEQKEPALARALTRLAQETWSLFGMRGYARIDFRIDACGAPMILEANPNPCLEPRAGFAAAAHAEGHSYAGLVEHILRTCARG